MMNFIGIFVLSLTSLLCIAPHAYGRHPAEDSLVLIRKENYTIRVVKKGFRYALLKPDGTVLLQAHDQSGLTLLHSQVLDTRLLSQDDRQASFMVTNDIGVQARVQFTLFDHYFKLSVHYTGDVPVTGSIVARTQGLSPAYGLADHAGFRTPYSTEITGYKSRYFGAGSDHGERLVSNFVIFPRQGVACINLEPHKKIISVSPKELAQGDVYASEMPALYYFTGSVKQIYADYLKVRNEEGYKVYLPKYAWFGVGWEAFGALGWNTNHETVTSDVDRYLKAGFPLTWMVVGSGFWPNDQPSYFATTSFGFWDKQRYPDPKSFIAHFHQEGLKFILGLRIAFIPNGPFTAEGLAKGYFIKKEGQSRLFRVGFPKTECYFLDATNPEAVKWYVRLCDKWKQYGVDGYKEDLYGYEIDGFRDDKLDPVNELLMDEGVYVMGRNGYVGSPADIHRFNDFNYNQNQDRGPVNGLAFAYSGFPYVYPDIIGGTGLTNKQFGGMQQEKLGKYLMREAQYAALNPSLSFGYGPWNLDDKQVMEVCLAAAQLHDRLLPYIYSAAIATYHTGFPYTMTPLPLAYPDDSATYYRENDRVRGYEWLIGTALLATPVYGNDYATATGRDVYLPAGKWMDYDSGKLFEGPKMLKDYPLPVGKTPLFVGGTGIVVEKENGRLVARIYPVTDSSSLDFYGSDSKQANHIAVDHPDWKRVRVIDKQTGKRVKVALKRYAWEFVLENGHDYTVK
ncbi:TIM-barrel domain-containing protein [Compostibacter hankyongensis]|uniref:Uncharacterized protein n=1 Tax=Compostibacter hankyongensis TaxID=1007089 RepID=A0ABP8FH04_9BACT